METHQYLSDDIVLQISTYLPAKSLMRFKCVSKAWNTMMQCPNFFRSHYARSQKRPSATRFLFQLETEIKRHRYLDRDNWVDLSLQLDYFCYDGEISICSNHCNGLVCLYSCKENQVYLYNVTTRERKALPPYMNWEITIKPYNKQPSKPFDKLFLGFDEVTGNYKLLLLFPHQEAEEAKILTLGVTNSSWRKIRLSYYVDYPCLCYDDDYFIFLNGVVYLFWYDYVAYFDFGEEKFGYISPPPQTNYFEGLSINQTAVWGQLTVRCTYEFLGPQKIFGYNDANKVLIPLESGERLSRPIKISLSGTESIADKKKKAHVLATASVITAPAFPLSSISLPCRVRFVTHSYKSMSPGIQFIFVSRFVENIIPLNSLLV
ncbi:hypothetical protein P3S67_011436 [Capsicum chacoense]